MTLVNELTQLPIAEACVAYTVIAAGDARINTETDNPTETPTEIPTEIPTETPTEIPDDRLLPISNRQGIILLIIR